MPMRSTRVTNSGSCTPAVWSSISSDQTVRLGAGDSAYFDASIGHKLRQVGAARAEVVVVTHAEPGTH